MKKSAPRGSRQIKIWSTLPIGVQLLLLLVGINAPIFLAYHFYDIARLRGEFRAVERSVMDALRPLVVDTVEHAMERGERGHIDSVFQELTKTGLVDQVHLLDPQGRVVEASRPANTHPGPGKDRSTQDPGYMLATRVPILLRPSCVRCHGAENPLIGYVRLVLKKSVAEEVSDYRRRMHLLMVLGGMGFLFLSVVLVVRRMVHAPMERLIAAMNRIKAGHLRTRIRDGSSKEMNVIVEGFNSMVEKLESDRREIAALHRRQVAHIDRLVTIGELSAHLAHEVRNPMTGISSAIQVMLRDLPVDNPRRSIFEKILGHLGRMERTMGSFLKYARMPEAVIRDFQVKDSVARAFIILEPRFKAQGVLLKLDIPPELPALRGDPSQIEQVFLNIGLNAGQAMPGGGTLTVIARKSGADHITVEFDDTGDGIVPENLEKVFQPFFTTRADGSGLGLAICRQLVLAQNGDISVESIKGKGTSIFVRLPAAGDGRDG